MKKKTIKIFRWTIRIWSGILILFFLFMFIGETFFPPESVNSQPLSAYDIFQLVLFGVIMIGLGLAWKWELTGGVIALIAYALMAIINPNIQHIDLLLLYPAAAILFILLWAVSRNVMVKNKIINKKS